MADEFPSTHFFKIICDQNLHQGKIMMPRKFGEKYGKSLPKAIYLKTPNGEKWKLNLVKSDGKIWFDKGWKEFADYHSLSHGHLLVFKYGKTSHLKVQIFDKSALEINYPLKRMDAIRVSNGQGSKSPNDEDLEDYIESEERKPNLSLEFHQPCEIGSSRCVNVGKMHHVNRKSKGKKLVIAKKVTALKRAISFKTCNTSFHVIMRPSYIDGRCNLYIPNEFGKRHLLDLDKENGDMHLRLLNGRVWHVKYLIRLAGKRQNFEVISKGWKIFAEDNNLKVGDVCTFELFPTSTHVLTLTVHIFRDS